MAHKSVSWHDMHQVTKLRNHLQAIVQHTQGRHANLVVASSYGINTKGKAATISIPARINDIASITHERTQATPVKWNSHGIPSRLNDLTHADGSVREERAGQHRGVVLCQELDTARSPNTLGGSSATKKRGAKVQSYVMQTLTYTTHRY